MTRKSQSRRAKDAATLQANGGKMPNARLQREKSSRCWYELKNVHARTVGYVNGLAQRMMQYANPLVMMKIAKNGDQERWELQNKILQERAATAGTDLEELWNSHKDKKHLCRSSVELAEALRIFEAYQTFDTDFYLTFSPIVKEMNEIFNKALQQLLDAQDELAKKAVEEAQVKLTDPSVVSDVNYAEVPATVTGAKVTDLPEPVGGMPVAEPKEEAAVTLANDLNVVGLEAEEPVRKTEFDRVFKEGDEGAILESPAAEEIKPDFMFAHGGEQASAESTDQA